MELLYDIYELIGEGSFGRVYRARCKRTNTQVAYKVISKNNRSLPEVHALRKECEIQKCLWHPNIIRMLHSFENVEELVVITEFAPKDLCHILKESGPLSETRTRKIVIDLVFALCYLHSNRILHRDLKPQNVLVDCYGNAKLCDFGFAKVLCRDSQMLTSIKGTPLYMAPELMQEHPYDHNADLWSLGCITYELVTGRPPYSSSSILQLINQIRLEPIKWPQCLSDVCLSFLKGLLNKNPAYRLTWPYLWYHPFVNVNACSNAPMMNDTRNVLSHQEPSFTPMSQIGHQLGIPTQNDAVHESDKYIPSHIIEIRDQQTNNLNNSIIRSQTYVLDPSIQAQKEEWLDCLKRTIKTVMYSYDVEDLTEEHSLMLIMGTFNTFNTCPVIMITVARLLSLPFVLDEISDSQLALIRETYASCYVIRDLLHVLKSLVRNAKNLNVHQEAALQQILLLICNLVFADEVLLLQFFHLFLSLNLFKTIKTFLSIRTKDDPLSIVKYIISILTRVYFFVPQSRRFILQSFKSCTTEFHSIFRETEDKKIHLKLCTFITMLGCTQPSFLRSSPNVDTLIEDLNKLNMNSDVSSSSQQVVAGTLEVLTKVKLRR